MAFPDNFSPGRKASGRGPEEKPKEDVSVDKALSVLEGKVKTSRGHAALKTLRSELEGSDQGGSTSSESQSPGQRAAAMFNQ